ncbi:hypothetical protein P7C70_g3187, partial [Phenoliferia sp. Uapishka_3]
MTSEKPSDVQLRPLLQGVDADDDEERQLEWRPTSAEAAIGGSPRWLQKMEQGSRRRKTPRATQILLLVVALSLLIVGAAWKDRKLGSRSGPQAAYLASGVGKVTELEVADPLESCGDECRFIFVPWIGGQETRAQEHLFRWGVVALAGESSRSSNWLVSSIFSHVRDGVASIDNTTTTKHEPDVLTIGWNAPFWKVSAGGVDFSLVKTLNPAAILPSRPFDHLAYAPGWAEMTAKIASENAPFVGIHWRTERVRGENFEPCTTSLMEKLQDLKRTYPALKAVYMASDYPLESLWDPSAVDATPHSGSLRPNYILPETHRAMRRLYDWFQSDEIDLRQTSWSKEEKFIDFPESTRKLLPEGTLLRDLDLSVIGELLLCSSFAHYLTSHPGGVGMIDKAVLFQSSYFLAGSQKECGMISSWTASVVTARRETLRGEGEFAGKQLWNDVDYWALPK